MTKVKQNKKEKKEKKPIQVVAIVTPEGIEGSFIQEPRKPLIVQFPFSSSEVKFTEPLVQYDPNPPLAPEPYDDGNYFQINYEKQQQTEEIVVADAEGWTMEEDKKVEPEGKEEKIEVVEQKQEKVEIQTPVSFTNGVELLLCYKTKENETFTPPEKTSVHCFWCSQQFENSPCFLPVKEESSIYHVYGNFCTPHCGLAYLLNEHIDSHTRWERMALLHRMYKTKNNRIYPAPPRESLKAFGGPYSYEEYRKICFDEKVRVDIQTPPLVSIRSILDTKPVDFYDFTMENNGGFSLDRFKNWSEQGGALRLKRSKPLKNRESTLNSCFQINIKKSS
jgi:hypothetical protein